MMTRHHGALGRFLVRRIAAKKLRGTPLANFLQPWALRSVEHAEKLHQLWGPPPRVSGPLACHLTHVRVARQTNHDGCELGWVAKQHVLSRAAAASWSGPSCQEGIAAASPPPTEAGAHQPRYPVTDNHTVHSHMHPWSWPSPK